MTRRIVWTGFMTVDGIVDSPGGPQEGHPGGGWVFDTEFVPESYELKTAELAETGALMFGARSYEAFASVWPRSPDHVDYRDLPKYVVSSTLTEDDLVDGWGQQTILRTVDDVAALKHDEGHDIYVHGSASLACFLAEAGLIDQYNLLVFPVLLGEGKSVFPRDAGSSDRLRLVESASYSNGVVKLVYALA